MSAALGHRSQFEEERAKCLERFEATDGLKHLCDKLLNGNRQHFDPGPHFCKVHSIGEGHA